MELVSAWGRALALSAATVLWCCIVLWGVQRLWPRSEAPSLRETFKAGKFWAIFLVVETLVVGAFFYNKGRITPLIDLRAHLNELPFWIVIIVGPLAFLMLYDFFNYWMHRAQHKWFWKQHRVHHSIKHLSGFNAYFHPTEPLFRVAAIYLPMVVLFGYGAAGWALAVKMMNDLQGFYVHSPTRLNYGPLRCVMVDNAFHRVHHSIEERHFDKNFGAFTTLWDRLFGTAHFPAKGEWPDTGVPDFEEVGTVGEYLTAPFLAGEAIDLAARQVATSGAQNPNSIDGGIGRDEKAGVRRV